MTKSDDVEYDEETFMRSTIIPENKDEALSLLRPTKSRPMTNAQAVRLAIKCMKKEIHLLAMPANLHERYGADFPSAINASKDRKKLREAIVVLEAQK
jgi:hypothetical protein